MYPAVRTMTIIGIMTLAVFSLTGCGEKRIHVATVSGTPGESMGLDEANQSPGSDTIGLNSQALDESNLGNGTSVAQSQPTEVEDSTSLTDSATDSVSTQPESQPGSTFPETMANSENEGLPLQEGSSLNTQSSSAPQDTASSTFDNLPHASFSDLGAGTVESSSQDSSAQESVHSVSDTPMEFSTGSDQGKPSLPNETNSNMEQIPNTLQVAKAEPSDSLREQMERMQSEELAAATAGLQDVFFQFDSWSLTEEGKQALQQNMGLLQHDPSANLLIEGHADQRGTQAYNMILGKKRAAAIRDYLNELGMDENRLRVVSYGKDKPFCQDPTEVCYQLNRRGHLLVQNPE